MAKEIDYYKLLQAQNEKDQYINKQGGSQQAPALPNVPQFASPWSGAMTDMMQQIASRKPYQFDLSKNGLYQQYKNQYTKLGQQAMKDTMGQAAGLTGGYGSSYGQNVGQQAYNAYLGKLNDIVPELYAQGRAAYDADTDAMYRQLGMYGDAYARDYNAWRDRIGDQRYADELAYSRDRDRIADDWRQREWDYNVGRDKISDDWRQREWDYNVGRDKISDDWRQREWDYSVGQDAMDREWQQRQWDYNVGQDAKDRAYKMAMEMIQTGQTPDAAMLQAAGIDPGYARNMAAWYSRQLAAKAAAGSGGGRSGGGRSGGYDYANIPEIPITDKEPAASKSGVGGWLEQQGSAIGDWIKGLGNPKQQPATNAELEYFAKKYASMINNKMNAESDFAKSVVLEFEERFGANENIWQRIKQIALDNGYIRGPRSK